MKTFFIFIFILFISAQNFTSGAFAQPKKDSLQKTLDSLKNKIDTNKLKQLLIDTGKTIAPIDSIKPDTITRFDSTLISPAAETTLTNAKLFLYIVLSVLGLALFFFIFVQTLFKTFHKTRSTRQSLLLSWNLFFIVSIIWLFIIWGIVAAFWSSAAFMVTMIFLFIVSLVMLIIAIKSK